MKRNSLARLGGVLVVALEILLSAEVRAIPFEKTPEGLISYVNAENINWKDSSKMYFYNPRDCYSVTMPDNNRVMREYSYSCEVDFNQTTALGKRTCINYRVVYNIFQEYDFMDKISTSGGYDSECSDWEKVSVTPDPQLTPPPPKSSQTENTTSTRTSTCLGNNLILAGGAGIFVAGGLLGVVFSQLLGRKKN